MAKLGSCELQNAVRAAIDEARQPLSAREVLAALQAKGIVRRIAQVSHSLSRMADRGVLDRQYRDQSGIGARRRMTTYAIALPRPAGNAAFTEALQRVCGERGEQLQRYPIEGDDQYAGGELWYAAVTYVAWPDLNDINGELFKGDPWPWGAEDLKPRCELIAPETDSDIEDRLRDLSKGLALGLAEMERLIRMRDAGAEQAS